MPAWRNDMIDAWEQQERERLDTYGLLPDDALDEERAQLEDDRPHLTLILTFPPPKGA